MLAETMRFARLSRYKYAIMRSVTLLINRALSKAQRQVGRGKNRAPTSTRLLLLLLLLLLPPPLPFLSQMQRPFGSPCSVAPEETEGDFLISGRDHALGSYGFSYGSIPGAT